MPYHQCKKEYYDGQESYPDSHYDVDEKGYIDKHYFTTANMPLPRFNNILQHEIVFGDLQKP
jgi:hypothetical protein